MQTILLMLISAIVGGVAAFYYRDEVADFLLGKHRDDN